MAALHQCDMPNCTKTFRAGEGHRVTMPHGVARDVCTIHRDSLYELAGIEVPDPSAAIPAGSKIYKHSACGANPQGHWFFAIGQTFAYCSACSHGDYLSAMSPDNLVQES